MNGDRHLAGRNTDCSFKPNILANSSVIKLDSEPESMRARTGTLWPLCCDI